MSEVLEFMEWKSGMNDHDLLHAFQSIKILSAIKFAITTINNKPDQLAAIQKEAAKWLP